MFELGDQPELVLQGSADAVRHAFGIAAFGSFPSELLQRLLRRDRKLVALFRILVLELVQREAAAVGDLQRAGKRLRVPEEKPAHLLERL